MKRVILLLVLILLISSGVVFAEVPCKINYQGRLIKDNVPVDGTKTMNFSIYNDLEFGDRLWTSGDVSVQVHNGLFRYVIGTDGEDLSSIFQTAGQALYLQVMVDGETLTPREELSAYPYAINSHLLEGKTTDYFLNASADTQTKQGDLNIMGNVGIGTTSPSHLLDLKSGNQNFLQFDRTGTGSNVNNTFDFRVSAAGSTDTDFIELHPSGLAESGLTLMGNGNVGIGTTSPGAKLDVNGSIRVGDGGTVISKIQLGHVGTGAQGSAGTSGSVIFPSAFASAPKVFLQVEDPNHTQIPLVFVTQISTTGFSWCASTYLVDAFSWLAIGE